MNGRAVLVLSLVLAVVVSCDGSNQTPQPPTLVPGTSNASPQPGSTGGLVPGPANAPSIGNAELRHPLIATSIDPVTGELIGEGTQFPTGTTELWIEIGWVRAIPGSSISARIWREGQETFAQEVDHTVINKGDEYNGKDTGGAGFVLTISNPDGIPDGNYLVQTSYQSEPDDVSTFSVGGVPPGVELGTGDQTGPIAYKPASDVLVITHASVLRAKLGDRADEVLTAAAQVGQLHDLDEDTRTSSGPDGVAAFIHDLLRSGGEHYVLIVGNDDAVPFVHVDNPLASEDKPDVENWELPADWLPSDDPYGDTIPDSQQTPDVAVARIPSSDDADLLLKQLGDNTPPDGHGYALINQRRRTPGARVLEAMTSGFGVEVAYSPPVTPDSFDTSDAASARYLYVLAHGIGVTTDSWYADIDSWTAHDPADGEWSILPFGKETSQAPAVSLAGNPGSQGVVSVGACYGAWTLDTIEEPQHKTADNNLALFYLKSGARAFVADTHLSYSDTIIRTAAMKDIPFGRTGFEQVFWGQVAQGTAPIDAFQAAKVAMSNAIDSFVQAGMPDLALYDQKTLHYMVYFGRP